MIEILAILGAFAAIWLFGERWHPLRPSTLKFIKEGGLRPIINLKAIHAYIYGRWTNQYIAFLLKHVHPRLGEKGKVWQANHYHGKIVTHELAKSIVTLDRDIPLQDLEQIIPYSAARNIVLQASPDIAIYECGCRNSRSDHCEPTQVCMVIGQPFVDFVIEHNPKTSRLVTKEEALEILKAEHERGHVHSAWFKDACLDRFYCICNCCKCCCGGIEAMKKHGIPMMAPSGYVAEINEDFCIGCGDCVDACPFDALSVNEVGCLEWEKCMGCGVCVNACNQEAISLVRDERKGLPLDVKALA